MWPLLENIFEYISFKHTWEDGTHRTEFKCENCYKIVDIGQNNEISYESETYTTGCFTCDRCRKMLKLYTSYQMHSVFLQTTREIFASKHHHLSLHITIFFILDVANIFLITVIYEDINIDIISYTIVFSCNPQEKYLHKNTVIYLS